MSRTTDALIAATKQHTVTRLKSEVAITEATLVLLRAKLAIAVEEWNDVKVES